MNFTTLKGLSIPEGAVTKIEVGGVVLWELNPTVYDDVFPITWNSYAVARAWNTTVNYHVKVSNLTPTQAEMEASVLTINGTDHAWFATSEVAGAAYTYKYGSEAEEYAVLVIIDASAAGTETGMYVRDVYTLDGETVDCTLAVAATGIYDAEQQGTVLYIKNAPATFSGNTLEVT